MRLLLDSHVLLWCLNASPRIMGDLRQSILTAQDVYVSSITPWELGIKRAQGKFGGPTDLVAQIRSAELKELAISFEHAEEANRLPQHHKDPFDRMLIAQTRCEDLTLVTHDKDIQKYDVPLLVV